MDLVGRHLPARTQAEVQAGVRRALAMASALGITTVHEANAGPELLQAYAALDSAGQLSTRVVAAMETDPQAGISQVDSLRAWRGRYAGSQHFSPRAAKIFADGVIEAKTAALLMPYLGSDDRGEPNLSPQAMDSLVAAPTQPGSRARHASAIGRWHDDRRLRKRTPHNGPRDARQSSPTSSWSIRGTSRLPLGVMPELPAALGLRG